MAAAVQVTADPKLESSSSKEEKLQRWRKRTRELLDMLERETNEAHEEHDDKSECIKRELGRQLIVTGTDLMVVAKEHKTNTVATPKAPASPSTTEPR